MYKRSLRLEVVLMAVALCVLPGVYWVRTTPYLAPAVTAPALLLALAWLLWRGLRWFVGWRVKQAWEGSPVAVLAEVSPSVRAQGLYLGMGFPWNGAYTQELETALATYGGLPVATDARQGHAALQAVGRAAERPLVLPWASLRGHVLLTGTTGSGKTRLFELLSDGAIHGEGPVIAVDPKGDREWLVRCAVSARAQGRPFALVAPAFPQQSATMNVLGTATMAAEVSARVFALMPGSGRGEGDPFFEQYPLALIERLAAMQARMGQPWTLEGLAKISVFRVHMEAFLGEYLGWLGFTHRPETSARVGEYKKAGRGDLLADALIEDLGRDHDYFMKVTSNLIPAFRGVTGEPLGHLFSATTPDLTWDRIVDERMVVYISLASMLLGDIANRIGRVILQDLVGFLGRRYAYGDLDHAAPLTILIDEFGDVAYSLFTNVLNKGGGAGARLILAQQSLADSEAPMGKAQSRRVQDNLGTKIWLLLADDPTAEEATKGLGTCTVHLPETGVGIGYGGVGGLTGHSSRRLVAKEVPLIRPAWLTALPRGEAFVRMGGEVWKVRIPLLPSLEGQVEALDLGEMWQGLAPDKENIACDTKLLV